MRIRLGRVVASRVALLLGVVLVLAGGAAQPATGELLYRAGDFNGGYTFGYEAPNGNYYRYFKDFQVPANEQWIVSSVGNVTVLGLHTLEQLTSARLEIRSGITVNNGGTLLAGENRPVVSTTFLTSVGNGPAYDYTVDLSQPLVLGPGLYYATLQPISPDLNNWFTGFTSGANAVGGPPIDGLSFQHSVFGSVIGNYIQVNNREPAITIYGTRIPEPGGLLAAGVAILAATARFRRTTPLLVLTD
ncbi:hypothetical protein [Fontivita pretiosa]|uniref:hypothetical protein n=1 Tax=Fontivita pretiosa TaxID=2989684 RepID=UPI003D17273E